MTEQELENEINRLDQELKRNLNDARPFGSPKAFMKNDEEWNRLWAEMTPLRDRLRFVRECPHEWSFKEGDKTLCWRCEIELAAESSCTA